MQPESIPRRFAAAAAAAALLAAGLGAAPVWRGAPEYVALFVPAAHADAYGAAVSADALDQVLAQLADDRSLVRTPDAWTARAQAPLDAFGRGGGYNRWQLTLLYGARQPRVARGARAEKGRVVEAWTLISPYPSPDLRRLEPGTLRIVLRIAP